MMTSQQAVEPFDGNSRNPNIGVFCCEGIWRSERTAAGERVVERTFACIRQTDETETFHE